MVPWDQPRCIPFGISIGPVVFCKAHNKNKTEKHEDSPQKAWQVETYRRRLFTACMKLPLTLLRAHLCKNSLWPPIVSLKGYLISLRHQTSQTRSFCRNFKVVIVVWFSHKPLMLVSRHCNTVQWAKYFLYFFTRARRYTSAVFQTCDLLGLQEGISARHCIKTDRRIEIVFGIDSTPSVYRNHRMCWKKELGYLSSETLPRFRAAPYMFTQRQPSTQSLGPRPTLEIDVSFIY